MSGRLDPLADGVTGAAGGDLVDCPACLPSRQALPVQTWKVKRAAAPPDLAAR
jgi:hypothetical protein